MVDEVIISTPSETAPAAVATPTPIEQNSAASTVEATPTPVETTTPAPEVTPAESAPASPPTPGAEEKPAEAKSTTLLGAEPAKAEEAPKTEAKPAEEAKPADTQKAEGSQSDEPASLPTYEEFKLPEGVSFQAELVGDFTKILGELENGPKTHEAMQEFGQKLVDKHVSLVKEGIEKVHQSYAATWEKQKTDWLDDFKNDPEIGGNRQDTTVSSAQKFINTHGGNEAEQTEFRQLMEKTGLGNNKVMIRLLAKASQNMAEGRMNPAQTPIKESKLKTTTLYGKSA